MVFNRPNDRNSLSMHRVRLYKLYSECWAISKDLRHFGGFNSVFSPASLMFFGHSEENITGTFNGGLRL